MRLRSLIALFAVTFTALTVAAMPRDLSPAAARADAMRDIQSGHIKIYMAGGRASTEVGVSAAERPLIMGLPRDESISRGCTDPQLRKHVAYAEAYNRVIVQHLRRSHARI